MTETTKAAELLPSDGEVEAALNALRASGYIIYKADVRVALLASANVPRTKPDDLPAMGEVVAVKALEWKDAWFGEYDNIVGWEADTPWGRLTPCLAGYRDSSGKRYDRHSDVPTELKAELIASATERYELHVRSALSVQPIASERETALRETLADWDRNDRHVTTVGMIEQAEAMADAIRDFLNPTSSSSGKG